MYRVAKKTTKRTMGHCLKCNYCRNCEKSSGGGVIVECTAPNRCMMTEFNANDFYCVEYKGIDEMTQAEKEAYIKKQRDDYSIQAYREYANKYYSKKEAKIKIKQFIEKMKGN